MLVSRSCDLGHRGSRKWLPHDQPRLAEATRDPANSCKHHARTPCSAAGPRGGAERGGRAVGLGGNGADPGERRRSRERRLLDDHRCAELSQRSARIGCRDAVVDEQSRRPGSRRAVGDRGPARPCRSRRVDERVHHPGQDPVAAAAAGREHARPSRAATMPGPRRTASCPAGSVGRGRPGVEVDHRAVQETGRPRRRTPASRSRGPWW